jgi:hypothetical protein
MDRGIANTLEKLVMALEAIAGDIAQLKLDITKLDARIAAIDIQVAGIHRRLDASPPKESDEGPGRDLDLEREVFGAFKAPRKPSTKKEQGAKPAGAKDTRPQEEACETVGQARPQLVAPLRDETDTWKAKELGSSTQAVSDIAKTERAEAQSIAEILMRDIQELPAEKFALGRVGARWPIQQPGSPLRPLTLSTWAFHGALLMACRSQWRTAEGAPLAVQRSQDTRNRL